jgi:hypothetical protein
MESLAQTMLTLGLDYIANILCFLHGTLGEGNVYGLTHRKY